MSKDNGIVILSTTSDGRTKYTLITPNGFTEEDNIESDIEFRKNLSESRFIIIRNVDYSKFFKE